MFNPLQKIFGTKLDRDLKKLKPFVDVVNALEPQMKKMTDEELQAQTPALRAKLAAGAPVASLLPEAFATIREASVRVLGMRHFDVQIMGGVALYNGSIAEMKTGEGKTLTGTLPLYLVALEGKGAHVVTVNDYLAKRDAEEMGVLYNWLGLSVGVILSQMSDDDRQVAYKSDITYGTNNEFAFDYLRDNMKFSLEEYVQRDHHFCIVDEVDSILIDEARTPLLISGPSEGDTSLYYVANDVIPKLKKDVHFTVDEKARSAMFTEDGVIFVQEILKIENLYNVEHSNLLHHLNQALKAHNLFKLDVDYVNRDGQIIIVMITVLNPKAIVFYLAFFPLFIDPAQHQGLKTFALMSVSIATLTFLYGLVSVLLTFYLAERIRSSPRVSALLNKVAGIFLVGFGIKLAISR